MINTGKVQKQNIKT